jgi:hypothetical protein
METVSLSGKRGSGLAAMVDDDDLPLVLPHRWWLLDPPRSFTRYAWSQVREDRCGHCGQRRIRTIRMHSLITGWDYVDHEDGNGLNNQRYNLREASQALNEAAKHKTLRQRSSRFKGVCWASSKRKWKAQITVAGDNKHLGYYVVEEDAARAYNAAALQAWGGFSRLNMVVPQFPWGDRGIPLQP